MSSERLAVGIVGGLCPAAAADIHMKAVRQVKVSGGDMDYPDIIISAAPEQEHRGNQLTGGRSYDMTHRLLYIYQVAADLKKRGVGKILVPDFLTYNSAKTISDNIKTPLVDIVGILADEIARKWPAVSRVGLLTTNMAVSEKVFDKKFADRNLSLVLPDAGDQESLVMEALYGPLGVKRGFWSAEPGALIRDACARLFSKGAELILTGVTELPLIDRAYYPAENYVDCNEVIAAELVKCPSPAPEGKGGRCVIGILGGLGPSATVDIFDKIVRNTPAGKDQDHIKIIIDNDPTIPDRTAALRGRDENPCVAMLAAAERLQASGADFIIVPCNTAHVFMDAVQRHIKIPVLSMIEETVTRVREDFPGVGKVGLLASSGTVESKVYETQLSRAGLTLAVPRPESQERLVMEAIYGKEGIKAGFKTGRPRELLLAAAAELVSDGAGLIILGCTEIPLALKNGDMSAPFIDPTETLAKSAVRHALRGRAPAFRS
jgi:aspartate racemase